MRFLFVCVNSEGDFDMMELAGKKKSAKGFASLSWSVRYKVAVGIADAIAYLHNGTEKCIVHRDIKPSNILLSSKKRPKVRWVFITFLCFDVIVVSDNLNAKVIRWLLQLCDFGLATWTPAPSVPFLCKTVKGTFGYDTG